MSEEKKRSPQMSAAEIVALCIIIVAGIVFVSTPQVRKWVTGPVISIRLNQECLRVGHTEKYCREYAKIPAPK